jgi:hypothetical protein
MLSTLSTLARAPSWGGETQGTQYTFHPIERGLELLVFSAHVSCRPHSGEAQLRRLDKLGTLVSNVLCALWRTRARRLLFIKSIKGMAHRECQAALGQREYSEFKRVLEGLARPKDLAHGYARVLTCFQH